MALFRKFFYRKPPDGLLEISERVYVFDCCFTTDVWEEDEYKVYIGGIVGQVREHFPDASFMVFNFREGENQSQISNILSEYDMTVMDYPRHYEGCPLLTMEMIHHFLRSSESWLSLGQQNLLLMHCERGGWPVLAFMLAALLVYRKQYTGEQKTLDMIYKQAPRELLQLMSPLNPMPSQLRYLQYVSRRNVGSEWPPLDRALTLDCVIIRCIPNMDGAGGCSPIFRLYGQDPFMAADRTTKVLFSTPKRSKLVRHYKQADCELVKFDIHCHVLGDVVLECISLDDDLEREEMMFRVMFNSAFIRSNILILNRDDIDILWNAKDQFPKDFRAEVLFSEIDAATSLVPIDLPGIEEKEGLPVEAFSKVQEIFSNVDWLDPKADAALNVLQQITASNVLQERLDTFSMCAAETGSLLPDSTPEKLKSETNASEDNIRSPSSMAVLQQIKSSNALQEIQEYVSVPAAEGSLLLDSTPENLKSESKASEKMTRSLTLMAQGKQSIPSFKPSLDSISVGKKIEPQELQIALQRPAKSKIISQRGPPTSLSAPVSYASSLQGSPLPLSRYHSAPSALGITALLHDHATSNSEEVKHAVTVSLPSSTTSASSISNVTKPVQPINVPIASKLPPLLPPFSGQSSMDAPITTGKTSASPPSQSMSTPISSTIGYSPPQQPGTKIQSSLPPPPPPPPFSGLSPSSSVKNSFSTPPPPSPPSFSGISTSSTIKNSFSTPPPPPPPPLPAVPTSDACAVPSALHVKNSATTSTPPLPPPPPHSGPASGPTRTPSAPPPPPPPGSGVRDSSSKNSAHGPPVPPPPAPFSGLTKAGSASPHSHSGVRNGNLSPIPGPPSGTSFGSKGVGLLRPSPRHLAQPKKTNLKPYHWLKLTRAMQGSLWADAQKADEASKAPEFDMSELESLFSATAPNSDQGSAGGKSNRRAVKSEKVQLIELRRAYNCEIMLTKVKVPLPELMSSVLALDESALDVDQVENLIKFCPTKEEIELLKGYGGDKGNLGKCEQFFLELMKVPRVESKLRVFSFKIQFHSQVSDLRNNLNVVNSASEEIRNSAKLKRIMQTILSLGNALNHGTARGSAIGFRLDSLLKLTDTRARNKKTTLMHYLCKVLAEKLPELLDFPKDLVSLEASTKIQLKYLAEEMQAISKGLEKVVQELTASENDGPVSDNFCKTLKEFLGFAEGEGRNADALALYFGEDPARCPFEQVVSTLLNFVRMFVRAHEENCKQIELEKKKAQKEEENEKVKVGTPKKESVHLRTAIRSGNIN
ncbi:formin-like protein 18 isoform X2 [Alnus glutinosa]|uniref:formin-like protein 18 isoform X2 n=1 Tax=Alnus glutinosa TaxID=3517 RepID=UPI002D786325|nr:formin-like protein 18 isoform X2 [Alnus glutinosa]